MSAAAEQSAENAQVPERALTHLIDRWAKDFCTCGGLAACVPCQYADRATFLLGIVTEDRAMFREKAHRFIAAAGRGDVRYGDLWTEHQSLVDALGDLTAMAETLAVMVVPASALRVFTEPHYRDDGPNGETTECHCGIGSDHTLEAMRDLYDEDGERR